MCSLPGAVLSIPALEMGAVHLETNRSREICLRNSKLNFARLSRFTVDDCPFTDMKEEGSIIGVDAFFNKHVAQLESAGRSTRYLDYENAMKEKGSHEIASVLQDLDLEVRGIFFVGETLFATVD